MVYRVCPKCGKVYFSHKGQRDHGCEDITEDPGIMLEEFPEEV